MKRIRVPDEMLKAAQNSFIAGSYNECREVAQAILDAALLWLSEHPQVPTDEQCDELIKDAGATGKALVRYPPRIDRSQVRLILSEWQRRCFQEEEPEIPEDIKDLVIPNQVSSECFMHPETYNQRINEAYRRVLTRGSVALRKGEEK